MAQQTEAQIKEEYHNLYQMYDKDGKGYITLDTLKGIVQEAGIILSNEDWNSILSNYQGVDKFDEETFTTMMNSCCVPPNKGPVIEEAFKVFDKANTTFANHGELKYV